MAGNEKQNYLYSVGGRVKFGETAEEAIIREVYEETGIKLAVSHLGFIHENYFYGDSPVNKNKIIYEISFYFYMQTPEDFEPECKSFTEDNYKEKLVWVTADSKIKYYPEFFRTELKHPGKGVKHIVTDERKLLNVF